MKASTKAAFIGAVLMLVVLGGMHLAGMSQERIQKDAECKALVDKQRAKRSVFAKQALSICEMYPGGGCLSGVLRQVQAMGAFDQKVLKSQDCPEEEGR